MNLKIWLAEYIGTFTLVFTGIAALATGASRLEVAVAFGLAVTVMIAAVGALSFAHFNPAVTVGFWIMRHISLKDMLLYWSAELSGALFALLCLSARRG